MKQISFATHRPVAVAVLFVAAVVFGWLSFQRLSIELMPRITYPTLTVRTEFPGAAPEEVENEVSRHIEEALGVTEGLVRVSSVSRMGISDVILEFNWDTDIDIAVQRVIERLDRVFLPREAKKPFIIRFDPSLDPVMELSVIGRKVGDRESYLLDLRRISDIQIKRKLETVKGVAAVQIRGGLKEQIRVRIDEKKLAAMGITPDIIVSKLRSENLNVAGGTLKEGEIEFLVRTLNEFKELDDIGSVVVVGSGIRKTKLGDIATISWSYEDPTLFTTVNEKPSVQLDLYKEGEANLVSMSKHVNSFIRKSLKPLAEKLGVEVQVVADRARFINASIKELVNTAFYGGILAVLVLYLFLRNFRTTAIVSVSIPVSILATFGFLNISNVSLNIMTLGGLALGIGMLVDSSIVVLEAISRHLTDTDIVEASIKGTNEVKGAVFASTLTSVAVFAPMVFVEGVAGEIFGDLALAVTYSLIVSLLVALYLIPMLFSRKFSFNKEDDNKVQVFSFFGNSFREFKKFYKHSRGFKLLLLPFFLLRTLIFFSLELIGALFVVLFLLGSFTLKAGSKVMLYFIGFVLSPAAKYVQVITSKLQTSYAAVLYTLLKSPVKFASSVFVILAGSFLLLPKLGGELLPELSQGEFTYTVFLPVGTPLETTISRVRPIVSKLNEAREDMGIEKIAVSYGFDPLYSKDENEGEHIAKIKVVLKPGFSQKEDYIAEKVREAIAKIPESSVKMSKPTLFTFKAPVEIEIRGDDLDKLREYAEKSFNLLKEETYFTDVRRTLKRGAPEVVINFDRDKLALYGLTTQEVSSKIKTLIGGEEATTFNLTDRRVPLVVRLYEDKRSDLSDLKGIVVATIEGKPILLSSVADISIKEGPSEIRRIDGQRVALVTARIRQISLEEAVKLIERKLSELEWKPGYSFSVGGQNREWKRSRASLQTAVFLAIFLVYIIMAAQFESFLYPLIIMFSVPFAFVGSILLLYITSTPVSVVVFIGAIMLTGIAVNNAIVLVDYIAQIKDKFRSLEDALVEAGKVRLRPILMTSATTVLGLLPLVLTTTEGYELRAPMALTVIGGLVVSTFLVLLMIPLLYMAVERLRSAFYLLDKEMEVVEE